MKIFKELNKIGYKHYTENTIEELDNLPLDSEERIMEQSLAFRWFREKHQIVCVIDFYNDGDLWEDTMYTVTISEFEHFKSHDSFVQFEYKTYEEAELACLRKLIELVKTKQ